MPKGVEHPGSNLAASIYALVIYPLMPKGVEHAEQVHKKFHYIV